MSVGVEESGWNDALVQFNDGQLLYMLLSLSPSSLCFRPGAVAHGA